MIVYLQGRGFIGPTTLGWTVWIAKGAPPPATAIRDPIGIGVIPYAR